jgi:hypothetical protein
MTCKNFLTFLLLKVALLEPLLRLTKHTSVGKSRPPAPTTITMLIYRPQAASYNYLPLTIRGGRKRPPTISLFSCRRALGPETSWPE